MYGTETVMIEERFVAYYRVSTDRQGRSGLGLEAQQDAIRRYLNGGGWTVIDEVVEVESGKRDDRPGLDKALGLCRAHRAKLIIAKLDRLARNVEFTARILNSAVECSATIKTRLPRQSDLIVAVDCRPAKVASGYYGAWNLS
jgi:hypothetical protein